MTAAYSLLYRALLQRIDPEHAHGMALSLLRAAQRVPGGLRSLKLMSPGPDPRLAVDVLGLGLPNPLGVAAGLDKDAAAVEALLALGFGHVEVGTVTPRPQPGNPRPRMWRLTEQRAVINALGFPSRGAAAVVGRLSRPRGRGVVGVNIGKNRDTSLERAADDYARLARELGPHADYLTINVSSPNTPGLRRLQAADVLAELVRGAAQAVRQAVPGRPVPVLVKLSPDEADADLEAMAEAAIDAGAAGIVATNTTIDRAAVPARHRDRPGGLSGAPLRARATAVTRLLYRRVGARAPIIGVGGIASAGDVIERIAAGASLVQLYTGFVFGGPALPGEMLRGLSAIADREGWSSIREVVGRAAG